MSGTQTIDVLEVVESLGIDIKRTTQREIEGWCPVHEDETGVADKNPSWSISRETGLWLCFSCGAKGNLEQLAIRVTGDKEIVGEIREYVRHARLDRVRNHRSRETTKYARRVDEGMLYRFVDVPDEYLHERDLSRMAVDFYGVRWDPEHDSWVLPLRDIDGNFIGWQEKRGKIVRNWPDGVVEKSTTLFGLGQHEPGEMMIVVESPLDVVRLYTAGYEGGLATMGAMVSNEQIDIIRERSGRQGVILAMDDDSAGRKANRRLRAHLRNTRTLYYGHVDVKDIGDMTDEEIDEAIERAYSSRTRERWRSGVRR